MLTAFVCKLSGFTATCKLRSTACGCNRKKKLILIAIDTVCICLQAAICGPPHAVETAKKTDHVTLYICGFTASLQVAVHPMRLKPQLSNFL